MSNLYSFWGRLLKENTPLLAEDITEMLEQCPIVRVERGC